MDSFSVEQQGPRRQLGGAGVRGRALSYPSSFSSPLPAPLRAMSTSKMFDLGLDNIDLWRSEEMQLVQVRLAGPARVSRAKCSFLSLSRQALPLLLLFLPIAQCATARARVSGGKNHHHLGPATHRWARTVIDPLTRARQGARARPT